MSVALVGRRQASVQHSAQHHPAVRVSRRPIDDPAASWLSHCGTDDPADIVNMDPVENLSLAFDDPCRAIAQPVEGAAPGSINAGCPENFRAKQI